MCSSLFLRSACAADNNMRAPCVTHIASFKYFSAATMSVSQKRHDGSDQASCRRSKQSKGSNLFSCDWNGHRCESIRKEICEVHSTIALQVHRSCAICAMQSSVALLSDPAGDSFTQCRPRAVWGSKHLAIQASVCEAHKEQSGNASILVPELPRANQICLVRHRTKKQQRKKNERAPMLSTEN